LVNLMEFTTMSGKAKASYLYETEKREKGKRELDKREGGSAFSQSCEPNFEHKHHRQNNRLSLPGNVLRNNAN